MLVLANPILPFSGPGKGHSQDLGVSSFYATSRIFSRARVPPRIWFPPQPCVAGTFLISGETQTYILPKMQSSVDAMLSYSGTRIQVPGGRLLTGWWRCVRFPRDSLCRKNANPEKSLPKKRQPRKCPTALIAKQPKTAGKGRTYRIADNVSDCEEETIVVSLCLFSIGPWAPTAWCNKRARDQVFAFEYRVEERGGGGGHPAPEINQGALPRPECWRFPSQMANRPYRKTSKKKQPKIEQYFQR